MFQAGAWQHLGKVASPISGKVERDLRMAQHSIDLLAMLESKTKGNLNPEETHLLQHVLYELRLNYVDERKKGEVVTDSSTQPESPGASEADSSSAADDGNLDKETD